MGRRLSSVQKCGMFSTKETAQTVRGGIYRTFITSSMLEDNEDGSVSIIVDMRDKTPAQKDQIVKYVIQAQELLEEPDMLLSYITGRSDRAVLNLDAKRAYLAEKENEIRTRELLEIDEARMAEHNKPGRRKVLLD
jgi:hypothetical protein